jgi:hypothetical protein
MCCIHVYCSIIHNSQATETDKMPTTNKWLRKCDIWKDKDNLEGTRWQIVDIPMAQWWLIILEKEDQRIPKVTQVSHIEQEAKPSLIHK